MKIQRTSRKLRTLDFDVETVAAGFADPNWVPQKITCVAWSWIGDDEVKCTTCGPYGIFGKPQLRTKMLAPFLADFNKADMVTGHNLIRFDLPIVNSECLRLGLPSLKSILVQDTMRIVKTKGFKKGQDNVAHLLKIATEKLALDWQQWDEAYDEADWGTVIQRCKSDVIGHKQMRLAMLEKGWLKPPITWRP